MSYTADVFASILRDIQNGENIPGGSATRKAEFSDGIAMVFSIATTTMTREVYITIPELPENIQFPRWHGIAIDIARLPVYGDNHYYVHFSQLPESEDYIFDIVMEDLRSAVSELRSITDCIGIITEILTKWKRFFQSERPMVMPSENSALRVALPPGRGTWPAEIVKRLYQSPKMKEIFPDGKKRLQHIFEKQVFGLAPTEIIYKIAISFILGFTDEIEIKKHNFRQADALPYAKEGRLDELLEKLYGEGADE